MVGPDDRVSCGSAFFFVGATQTGGMSKRPSSTAAGRRPNGHVAPRAPAHGGQKVPRFYGHGWRTEKGRGARVLRRPDGASMTKPALRPGAKGLGFQTMMRTSWHRPKHHQWRARKARGWDPTSIPHGWSTWQPRNPSRRRPWARRHALAKTRARRRRRLAGKTSADRMGQTNTIPGFGGRVAEHADAAIDVAGRRQGEGGYGPAGPSGA